MPAIAMPMLRGSEKPCTTWPLAGQMKPLASAAAGAVDGAGLGAAAAGGGDGAVGGADATVPGVAAGGADAFSCASNASEYGCFVARGSVFSRFVDVVGGGAAIVPPGPGSGRDSTRLDGTGVASITIGPPAAGPASGVTGAAAAGAGATGAGGGCAGRTVGMRWTIGAGCGLAQAASAAAVASTTRTRRPRMRAEASMRLTPSVCFTMTVSRHA